MSREYHGTRIRTDFLVIGSGIAGLSFALKAAEHGRVMVITKAAVEETNTRYAQGGIAAAIHRADSAEKHVQDTLKAGAGLCNEAVVRMVVAEAPKAIRDLIDWGARFDRHADGSFDLAREGGHSEHRVLHHKDSTGLEIQQTLTARARSHPNIQLMEHHFAIDLMTQHHMGREVRYSDSDIECYGAYVLDLRTLVIRTILSRVTLLATGGAGNLYATTTNPVIATGDGIAMVYRAKGTCDNLEFIQFHPTALYIPGEHPSFLITEALRGFGAVLKTQDGRAFMSRYNTMAELAPRDIVARAIDNEMKKRGDDYVYLDCSHLDGRELKHRFPNIRQKCLKHGLDITTDPIPVAPAAHYMCGGIRVDPDGRTHIRRLYAAGECSSTGLHGANRLASNSLIEAVVYADRAARHAIGRFADLDVREAIPDWNEEGTTTPREMVLITQNLKELQQLMTSYVGIVRSDRRLERASTRVEVIYRETEDLYRKSKLSRLLCELRNLVNVAYLVIQAARHRKDSIGLHYNIDYPSQDSPTEA